MLVRETAPAPTSSLAQTSLKNKTDCDQTVIVQPSPCEEVMPEEKTRIRAHEIEGRRGRRAQCIPPASSLLFVLIIFSKVESVAKHVAEVPWCVCVCVCVRARARRWIDGSVDAQIHRHTQHLRRVRKGKRVSGRRFVRLRPLLG